MIVYVKWGCKARYLGWIAYKRKTPHSLPIRSIRVMSREVNVVMLGASKVLLIL